MDDTTLNPSVTSLFLVRNAITNNLVLIENGLVPDDQPSQAPRAAHDLDLIFHDFKQEIDDLLSQLKTAADKRDDDASKTFSMEMFVKGHLQIQQDLAGCRTFVERYGTYMAGAAKKVFVEDAAKWSGNRADSEEGAGEKETSKSTDGEQAARVQQKAAFEAIHVAGRLDGLLHLFIRGLALLPEEDLRHQPASAQSEESDVHWSAVLAKRVNSGRS